MNQPKQNNFQTGEAVAVCVFSPVRKLFDYQVSETVALGDVVEVPFGSKTLKGVVWAASENEAKISEKIKPIKAKLNYPAMSEAARNFAQVMSDYTLAPLGQILPLFFRAAEPKTPKPNALEIVPNFAAKLSPKRAALFEELKEKQKLRLEDIQASRGVINGLVEQGAAKLIILETAQSFSPKADPKTLTASQNHALEAIRKAENPILLKGITGSGKTEVYLEAIEDVLKAGKQALILLPEIALTNAFLERFFQRFGFEAGHWHSNMTQAERRDIWHGVANETISVVIGARSSLFLPFQKLDLIVVDEEHDRGYKQEDGVIYHARDMSVLRGHIEGAKVILASATPSIESMVNAETGRYIRVNLEERYGAAELPQMRLVDMRDAALGAGEWISPLMLSEIKTRMEADEQSLLFLNRRGYAPLTLCRACGHQIACPNCDARMVEHKKWKNLQCHQCGYSTPIPKACPNCGAEEKLVPIGPGVERVAEEIEAHFPEAKLCILSSDLAQDEDGLRQEITAIREGEYDIIIGTQMVAKGHNFPQLTLVGIVDADIGLEGGDLRAPEQSFQILRQVSGRAGRFEKPGIAMVQSYQPEHPILRAIISADDNAFYKEEIERRKLAHAPPYSRYIAIIIWTNEFEEGLQIGRKLLQSAQGRLKDKGISVWGPTLAPIARIRNRARVRMLLKLPKNLHLHADVLNWVESVKTPSNVKVQIDVDPQSFL